MDRSTDLHLLWALVEELVLLVVLQRVLMVINRGGVQVPPSLARRLAELDMFG